MARKLFNAPVALVSLMDKNRQWFKSSSGLAADETPRDISFCGHAILNNQLLVVPDTLEDERFLDNPLVLGEPYIRFYAGCLIKAPDGHNIGTFCIIDYEPREFSEEDKGLLTDLASMVEREIAAVQMATMDELTDISNRRGFMILGEHSLQLCTRKQLPASLAFIDLDGFKQINDDFGHAEGDMALKRFTEQVKVACRDSDITARIGGDEFALFLIDTPRERAEEVLSRLRQSIKNLKRKRHCPYGLSFSYGIVEFDPECHDTLEAMLADGDALMYDFKRSKP